MNKPDWNPHLYLQFSAERSAPSVDLTAKIAISAPKAILDVGCGPGNSASVLLSRWPETKITGIDSSPAMIVQAEELHPAHVWRIQDAGDLRGSGRYDLVFSNAALQWMPSHETLLPALAGLVNKGGALAAQVPRYDQMPVSSLIDQLFHSMPGVDLRFGRDSAFTFHDPAFYDNLLRPLGGHFAVWETTYFHRLGSHAAIVKMLGSTGLRPYIERLPEGNHEEFERRLLAALPDLYPSQKDGAVLFPFRRLFFVWYPEVTAQ